jgi:hypothetical protein
MKKPGRQKGKTMKKSKDIQELVSFECQKCAFQTRKFVDITTKKEHIFINCDEDEGGCDLDYLVSIRFAPVIKIKLLKEERENV